MQSEYVISENNCQKEFAELPGYASTCRFCDTCMNPVFDFRRSTVEEFELTKREFGENICGNFLTDRKGDILFLRSRKKSFRTKLFLLAFVLCFSDSLIAGDLKTISEFRDIKNEFMLLTDSGKTDVVFTLYDARKKLKNKEVQIINNGDTIQGMTNKKGELMMTFVSSDTLGQVIFVYNEITLAVIESEELVGSYFKNNSTIVGRYSMAGKLYRPGKFVGRTRARF